ncbi:MAG: LD-carboxypeptidase [Bacteroidetes bacterium]|nr:LD-carboxypeptidase [Bacteroidota bacterium]
MIIPPYLRSGDTIALTATARSIKPEQIEPSVKFMEDKGFKVLIDPDLFKTHHQFGGHDAERAHLFNRHLANPEVRALWNVRGGYGTGRMVDDIDFDLLRKDPKWLIGFSDYTVIHGHANRQLSMATMHATMPVFMFDKTGRDLEDVTLAHESLYKALTGEPVVFDLSEVEQVRTKDFEGEVIGGNLSVLISILGTDSEPLFDNNILFLEDLDEYFYHIDRMMQNLRRSGKLSKLRALLVGSFIQMHDHQIPFGMDVKDIIKAHCADFDFPIIFDVNSGHHLQNMAIPFGVPAKFQNGILNFAGK